MAAVIGGLFSALVRSLEFEHPIESVWYAIERRLSSRQFPSDTVQELRRAIHLEYTLLLQSLSDDLKYKIFAILRKNFKKQISPAFFNAFC